jgi:outer membrane protein assembly factor BamB
VLRADSSVLAVDVETGAVVWSVPLASLGPTSYVSDFVAQAGSTSSQVFLALVNADRVNGASGNVACLDAASGAIAWVRDAGCSFSFDSLSLDLVNQQVGAVLYTEAPQPASPSTLCPRATGIQMCDFCKPLPFFPYLTSRSFLRALTRAHRA